MNEVKFLSIDNKNELKNKLTNWLLEEGVTVTQIPDENVEFRLQVTWGYVIDVVKLKGIPRIVATAKLGFTDEISQKAFSKLTKKDRTKMSYEIQNELTKFPIGYAINPNVITDKFESVDFHYNLYIEDLTKTTFMTSIDVIRRSMVCLNGICNNKMDIETNIPKPSDNKAGVG